MVLISHACRNKYGAISLSECGENISKKGNKT
jgi:hypothetical protein